MIIYYFKKDIKKGNSSFGTGEENCYLSADELVKSANKWFSEENEKITKKDMSLIVSKEIPDFDFWAVQAWTDGFGNDTYTICCFKTKEEALNYMYKNKEHSRQVVVGQWFGKPYRNFWDD